MKREDSDVVSSEMQEQPDVDGDLGASTYEMSREPFEGSPAEVEGQMESECVTHEVAYSMEREDPDDASRREVEEQELSHDVKREMLPDVCKGVVVLRCESDGPGECCHVYLVGTAHVSQDSCREVQAAIRFLKPQVVFLELCDKRSFMLVSANFHVPTMKEMLNMWREKRMNILGILYSWFLAKVAEKMDVFPGSEFRVAFEEAKSCGALVVLGDRDVQVTLRRTWSRMNLWHKMKFVFCMVFQAISLPSVEDLKQMIQELQDVDMLTLAFQELSKSFPTLMETLVYERDMFMAAMLKRIAKHHSSIVAVVGKGHISGIAKNWDQDISIHTLMVVPGAKTLWTRSFKLFLVGALIVVLVAFLSQAYFLMKGRMF